MKLDDSIDLGILRVPLREYMDVITPQFSGVPIVLLASHLSTELKIGLGEAGKIIDEYNKAGKE